MRERLVHRDVRSREEGELVISRIRQPCHGLQCRGAPERASECTPLSLRASIASQAGYRTSDPGRPGMGDAGAFSRACTPHA